MRLPIPARGYDFHCHVDLHPHPTRLIAACDAARIFTLAVTTTPKAWPQNQEWAASSLFVRAAIGLHPELVTHRHDEVGLLETGMNESRFVGEIGLDGSSAHRKSLPLQMEVFVRALTCAQRLGDRVASIHSRRAADAVLDCLEAHTSPDRVLPILHWFSGSPAASRRASSLGCYFSINHRTLQHKTGIALVRSLPEDRLLTETDAPFASAGQTMSDLTRVATTSELLAAARGASAAAMKQLLAANAQRVLAFAGV